MYAPSHPNNTQLVFHFAKHDEIKRMTSIMDIALLLERVRDAFLADRSSLLGADGVLSSHFANEIDVTVRVRTSPGGACQPQKRDMFTQQQYL